MREKTRIRIFFVFGGIFLCLFGYAAMDLPPWGSYRGPYGDVISKVGVYERHATDAVNAINYDYRAFDTLGEEFILFSAESFDLCSGGESLLIVEAGTEKIERNY